MSRTVKENYIYIFVLGGDGESCVHVLFIKIKLKSHYSKLGKRVSCMLGEHTGVDMNQKNSISFHALEEVCGCGCLGCAMIRKNKKLWTAVAYNSIRIFKNQPTPTVSQEALILPVNMLPD